MSNIKIGLDYFPFDVGFFDDDKIAFVSARFQDKGEMIAIKILCRIYKDGYFCKWSEDEAMLFAKRVVGDPSRYPLVNDVVHELIKRGFFDKSMFDTFNILTSAGIQKRFLEATVRRKKVELIASYCLVDTKKYQNVYILNKNVSVLPQSKVEESKQESKVEESKSKSHSGEPPAKEKTELIFWKPFVNAWNDWYKLKIGNGYNYLDKDFAHLKKIYKFLEKRAIDKNFVFNEENLVMAFQFFLNKAWDKDEWLRQNFSIPNVLSQFNQIANAKPDRKNGKQPTGGQVDTGSILSRINSMPD